MAMGTVRLMNTKKDQKTIEWRSGAAPTDAAVKAHAAKHGISFKSAMAALDDRELRTINLGGSDSRHEDWPASVEISEADWTEIQRLPSMRRTKKTGPPGWLDSQEITADRGAA